MSSRVLLPSLFGALLPATRATGKEKIVGGPMFKPAIRCAILERSTEVWGRTS